MAWYLAMGVGREHIIPTCVRPSSATGSYRGPLFGCSSFDIYPCDDNSNQSVYTIILSITLDICKCNLFVDIIDL